MAGHHDALLITESTAPKQMRLAALLSLLLIDAGALLPLATHRAPIPLARVRARMGWAEAKKKREEEDRVKFAEMQELREREAVKCEATDKVEREREEEKRRADRERMQRSATAAQTGSLEAPASLACRSLRCARPTLRGAASKTTWTSTGPGACCAGPAGR